MTEDEEAKWISEQCAAYQWLQKQPMVTVKRKVEMHDELLAALKQSAEGWANAIELGIIAEQHRTSAGILRDNARAAIARAEGRT